MNRKSILVISFFALSIFLVTIIISAVKIGISASEGKLTAKDQFTVLVHQTFDLLEMYYDYDSNDTFVDSYTETIKQMENVGAVIINNGDTVYFAYPLHSRLISQDGEDQFSIRTNSSFVSVYSSTIPLEQGLNLTVTGALYHITPSIMYSYTRNAFMIILVTTLSIFLLIFIQSIYLKKNNPAFTITTDTILSKKDTAQSDAAVTYPVSVEKTAQEASETSETAEDSAPEAEAEAPTPFIENESLLGEKVSDPLGLFSKDTGFGWESYLETRLDAELARAASSEQDLALIILRIKDSSRKDSYSKQISSVLIDAFKFRDLIFEYGSDGFACIIQEMDLDMAMKLCENLYTSLQAELDTNSSKNRIGIGISTRTLRIIPGSRILKEASQACEKSFEEDGMPIVAFRVSPDKYRKFLSEVENN